MDQVNRAEIRATYGAILESWKRHAQHGYGYTVEEMLQRWEGQSERREKLFKEYSNAAIYLGDLVPVGAVHYPWGGGSVLYQPAVMPELPPPPKPKLVVHLKDHRGTRRDRARTSTTGAGRGALS